MATGLYAALQQADLRRAFETLAALPPHYGLSHCDLHPWNAVVTPEGRIVLLDWGAVSRDINLVPHVTLGLTLWDHEAGGGSFRAFLSGYGISEAAFEALLPEVLAVDLIGCFWFCGPPRSEFDFELLARVCRIITEYLPLLTDWAGQPPRARSAPS